MFYTWCFFLFAPISQKDIFFHANNQFIIFSNAQADHDGVYNCSMFLTFFCIISSEKYSYVLTRPVFEAWFSCFW